MPKLRVGNWLSGTRIAVNTCGLYIDDAQSCIRGCRRILLSAILLRVFYVSYVSSLLFPLALSPYFKSASCIFLISVPHSSLENLLLHSVAF